MGRFVDLDALDEAKRKQVAQKVDTANAHSDAARANPTQENHQRAAVSNRDAAEAQHGARNSIAARGHERQAAWHARGADKLGGTSTWAEKRGGGGNVPAGDDRKRDEKGRFA